MKDALRILFVAVCLVGWTSTWDFNFEQSPFDSDRVSQGDDEIRELKVAVRERGDVGHQWADTGFHREGTAWALLDSDCGSVTIDADHESGRICIDTDDWSIWVLDAVAAAYLWVGASQQYAMILWDQATGDEDCDGIPAADECPCGYSENTEFQNVMVRGADTLGLEAWIPNDAGESCVDDGSGNDPPCVTETGRYDDQIRMTQMPSHDHDDVPNVYGFRIGWDSSVPGGLVFDGMFDYSSGMIPPLFNAEGGDEDHYHPFRTVLFCMKD